MMMMMLLVAVLLRHSHLLTEARTSRVGIC